MTAWLRLRNKPQHLKNFAKQRCLEIKHLVWRKPNTAGQYKCCIATVKDSSGAVMILDSFSSHRSWIRYSLWADHERLCIPKYSRLKLKLRPWGSGAWSKSRPQLSVRAVHENFPANLNKVKKYYKEDGPATDVGGVVFNRTTTSHVTSFCSVYFMQMHTFIHIYMCVSVYTFIFLLLCKE